MEGGGGRTGTTARLYLIGSTSIDFVDRVLERFLTQPLWSVREERERNEEMVMDTTASAIHTSHLFQCLHLVRHIL